MLLIEDVHKSFGPQKAVDGISLRVESGEVFGLLGPNGAGKTTTISMTVGLLEPDQGRVDIASSGPPSSAEARRHLGVCPQSIALYDELSAMENLVYFAKLYGLSGRPGRARASELLDLVGLTDRARSRVKTFSGGMKRRLNLASALVHDPSIVLLDEPTAGVDPQSRNAIFDLVESIREQGKAVVYTTHYMEEAERLCSRVGIVDHGKLLAVDNVPGLVREHGGASTVTIEWSGKEPETIVSDEPVKLLSELPLSGQGGAILGVRVEPPSLEAVFLNLTGRSLRD